MSQNLFVRFSNLVQKPPLQVGEVIYHNADGTSTIQLISGGEMRVRGQSVSVGQHAFFRDGLMEGQAPNLGGIVIEI